VGDGVPPGRERPGFPPYGLLKSFISQYNAEHALIMTGSVLSVLPIAIVFLLGQRYFVAGIASTGLKG
jgi:multiple sugar transport system permease protein